MKTLLFYTSLLLFILLNTSCECTSKGSGIVVERETNIPLENVAITIYLSEIHGDSLPKAILTDKNGSFGLTHSYCSDYMLNFHKEGYINFVQSMPQGDTIFLERTKEEE